MLYFSFEDERLADMQVQDLDLLVESFYQLNPSWRDADLDNPDTLPREVRALQDAGTTWPNASLQLITFNQPKGILPPEIQLCLASDWLLMTGQNQ